jgi:Mg2+-importing ATPase
VSVPPAKQGDGPAFWAGPIAPLLARLEAKNTGLTALEAASRLAAYGPNDPAAVTRRPGWLRFAARLGNPLVIVLLVASGLSAVTGDVSSFVIVAAIVSLSMVLDFFQESRAQNTIEALRRSIALRATARRNGAAIAVPVDQIVPGDVVELIAGDLIPADGRILESRHLYVNQALLTGEPYPAEKRPADNIAATDDPVTARNALFAGTSVVSGTGTMLVCCTGKQTALGHLARSLTEKPPATDFERGVRRFGMLIVRFTVLLVLFVLAVNAASHRAVLESVMFALALAVGLTPELLPMIVTITLARAAMDLARRKVIVKRLAAIHDIGAMDVLCTDKTGTLTEARIELVRTIEGFGGASEQTFLYAWLNSHFESGMKSPLDDAILAARVPDVASWRKLDEVPFDFERRRVSVLLEHDGERRLLVKGAPEDILRLSDRYEGADGRVLPLEDAARRAFAATFDTLGGQGYRALGIATRLVGPEHPTASVADEAGLVFAGYAVFLDPPKASAGSTIKALRADGVTVKLLTGDNERVARHVFSEIGLEVTGVLTGDALAHLPEEALIGQLRRTNLFCRVTPQQKLRILLGLKRMGHVVGFLGDGINDAPALHASDVGISVDGAADVARQAADLLLLEHELSVVHQAILQGRQAVQNVRNIS